MNMFTSANVRLDVPASSQREALTTLADFATELGYVTDAEATVTAMAAREEQVSTALMDGIAIPHAKDDAISSPALIVQRYAEPIDWKGEPVTVTLAMLVPAAEAGTTHLQLLAQVSRALMKSDLRAILTTGSADQIATELESRLSL